MDAKVPGAALLPQAAPGSTLAPPDGDGEPVVTLRGLAESWQLPMAGSPGLHGHSQQCVDGS